MLKRLVPDGALYAHDDWDRRTENVSDEDQEFGQRHSHCMSMLLAAGESVPGARASCASVLAADPLPRSSTASATAAGSSRSSASELASSVAALTTSIGRRLGVAAPLCGSEPLTASARRGPHRLPGHHGRAAHRRVGRRNSAEPVESGSSAMRSAGCRRTAGLAVHHGEP